MIIYQLQCQKQHTFEGWFRSASAFDEQLAAKLVECPVCGDHTIARRPAGAHVARSEMPSARDQRRQRAMERQRRELPAASDSNAVAAPQHDLVLSQEHSELLRAMKQFLSANTENVGQDFAEVARRIHFGEEPHRSIRGKVTTEEAIALHEEGVPAWPVPPGIVFNEDAQ
jgi:hypothetical protein